MKKISQTQIAKITGVAQCTVSRVLRGTEGVSVETREKVLAALRQNNYRSAELLPVAVLAAEVAAKNIYNVQLLGAINQELEKQGIVFEVIFRNNMKLLLSRSSAGIISICYDHRFEREISGLLSIPIVGVNTNSNFSTEIFSVCSDEKRAMRQACRSLFEAGHRKIGCLCRLYSSEYSHKLRKSEFSKQCEELGIHGEIAEVTGNLGKTMRNMADRAITGIIIASEQWSHDVRRALILAKLRVPEDISVIAWADSQDYGMEQLNLTTLCQDYKSLARESVKLLRHQIMHEFVSTRNITVPYFYTSRGSEGIAHSAGSVPRH